MSIAQAISRIFTAREADDRAAREAEANIIAKQFVALLAQQAANEQEIQDFEKGRPAMKAELDALRARGWDISVADADRIFQLQARVEQSADMIAPLTVARQQIAHEIRNLAGLHPDVYRAVTEAAAPATPCTKGAA